MPTINNLSDGRAKLVQQIQELTRQLEQAKSDLRAIEQAEQALLRLKGKSSSKFAPGRAKAVQPSGSRSDLVKGILLIFTEHRKALTRRDVSDLLLKAGIEPQGKYFENTVAKALKRLVSQGFLDKFKDKGAVYYQPKDGE